MTKTNIKRHLSTIAIVIVAIIGMFVINTNDVYAKKVLVDDGVVKLDDSQDSSATGAAYGEVDFAEMSNSIFSRLNFYLNAFSGVVLITLTLGFVMRCGSLAMAADNAQKRGGHIEGMLWIVGAVAALGVFSTIMSLITGTVINGI